MAYLYCLVALSTETRSSATCITEPASTSSPCQNRRCEAQPITPPQSAERRGLYRCIVDYHRRPFAITWRGSPEYPDLRKFPLLENVDISSVDQSSEMAAIWKGSNMIDYGSYASIRITDHDIFPILKLAHSDELSIKLIQHEFNVLTDLTKIGLPVVQFDHQPILDNGVTCGYRMEKLSKLELSELYSRSNEIKHILDRFHSAGYCHGDFTPSNIMKDQSDRIILIDFSFAGQTGSAVPQFFPRWLYTDGTYGIDSDLAAFQRYAVPR
jgi:hypothetical protein